MCYVVIDENLRGKGFGITAMKMVEIEIKKLGLKTIRLHVLKDNLSTIKIQTNMNYLGVVTKNELR